MSEQPNVNELESCIATVAEIGTKLEQERAKNAALVAALKGLLELCNHGDFSNGVTDATGSIDEGAVRASGYFHEARAALALAGATP